MFAHLKVYTCAARANKLNTPGIDRVVKQMVSYIQTMMAIRSRMTCVLSISHRLVAHLERCAVPFTKRMHLANTFANLVNKANSLIPTAAT